MKVDLKGKLESRRSTYEFTTLSGVAVSNVTSLMRSEISYSTNPSESENTVLEIQSSTITERLTEPVSNLLEGYELPEGLVQITEKKTSVFESYFDSGKAEDEEYSEREDESSYDSGKDERDEFLMLPEESAATVYGSSFNRIQVEGKEFLIMRETDLYAAMAKVKGENGEFDLTGPDNFKFSVGW